MKSFVWAALCGIALSFGACRDSSQGAGPDLATPLVGEFSATYLINDPISQQSLSSGSFASIRLRRKNNNTITIDVSIVDGAVQVKDLYEATITPTSLAEDGLLLPGLQNRYKLTATHLNNKGTSVSNLNLYQDGKIRGGLVYTNSLGKTISLAFLP